MVHLIRLIYLDQKVLSFEKGYFDAARFSEFLYYKKINSLPYRMDIFTQT